MTAMTAMIQSRYIEVSEESVPTTRHQAAIAAMGAFTAAMETTFSVCLTPAQREWRRWSVCMRWLAAIRQLGLEDELASSVMFTPARIQSRAVEHAKWGRIFKVPRPEHGVYDAMRRQLCRP